MLTTQIPFISNYDKYDMRRQLSNHPTRSVKKCEQAMSFVLANQKIIKSLQGSNY